MITINLLPQDMRKRERTPLVVLLPILGGLICVLSAGAVAAYVHFVWLAEVTNQRTRQEQELAQKAPQLAYEKRLLAEEADYKKRVSTIEQIAAGRILMTKTIDELAELTVNGDDDHEEGHLIWVQEMKFSPPSASRGRRGRATAKSGGTLSIKGYALADEKPLQHLNFYHARWKNSLMFKLNYNELSDPTGAIEIFSDDVEPKKGWTMNLVAQLKDPAEARKLRRELEGKVAEAEKGKAGRNAGKGR